MKNLLPLVVFLIVVPLLVNGNLGNIMGFSMLGDLDNMFNFVGDAGNLLGLDIENIVEDLINQVLPF